MKVILSADNGQGTGDMAKCNLFRCSAFQRLKQMPFLKPIKEWNLTWLSGERMHWSTLKGNLLILHSRVRLKLIRSPSEIFIKKKKKIVEYPEFLHFMNQIVRTDRYTTFGFQLSTSHFSFVFMQLFEFFLGTLFIININRYFSLHATIHYVHLKAGTLQLNYTIFFFNYLWAFNCSHTYHFLANSYRKAHHPNKQKPENSLWICYLCSALKVHL